MGNTNERNGTSTVTRIKRSMANLYSRNVLASKMIYLLFYIKLARQCHLHLLDISILIIILITPCNILILFFM